MRSKITDPQRALAIAVVVSAWREAEKSIAVMRTTRDDVVRQCHLNSIAACYNFLEAPTLYHELLELDPKRLITRFRENVDQEEFRTIQHVAESMQ